jgi:hypothetical protein
VSESTFGAVAQLGERLICIQEVVGSIPISSTSRICEYLRCVLQERSAGFRDLKRSLTREERVKEVTGVETGVSARGEVPES